MTKNDPIYIKVGKIFEIFAINSENWLKTLHLIFTTTSASFTSSLQTVHVIKPVDEFLIRKLQVTLISILFDLMLSNSDFHACLVFFGIL